jgi:RpiR family carbohydrate utilization transcriptional regulator
MQVMSATLLRPGDCLVIISNSGRTRDLMDATDIARKNGATTIAITASGSPLASRLPHPPGGRPPRGLRPLQPHGVAPAAPAGHRRAGHLRGAAHRQPRCSRLLQQMKDNLRIAKRYRPDQHPAPQRLPR